MGYRATSAQLFDYWFVWQVGMHYLILFIVVLCLFGGILAPLATRKTRDVIASGDAAATARVGVSLAVLSFMLPLACSLVTYTWLYELLGWQTLLIPGISMMFGIHLGTLALFCGLNSLSQPIGKILTLSTTLVLGLWGWYVFQRFFA